MMSDNSLRAFWHQPLRAMAVMPAMIGGVAPSKSDVASPVISLFVRLKLLFYTLALICCESAAP